MQKRENDHLKKIQPKSKSKNNKTNKSIHNRQSGVKKNLAMITIHTFSSGITLKKTIAKCAMAKKMPLRIIWKMPRSVGFAHDENGEGRPAGEGLTALSLASPRQEIVLYVFFMNICTRQGDQKRVIQMQ